MAIHEIRDRALMLSVGNAYLCEGTFLKKIGNTVAIMAAKLKDDIDALKNLFPGKFVSNVNTDEILEQIEDTAKRLKEPDRAASEECKIGAIGNQLEAQVKSLEQAIAAIRMQVEGGAPQYTRKDALLRLFGSLGILIGPFRNIGQLLLKVCLCLVVILLLLFGYWFFTMQKEGDLLQGIAQDESFIRSQQAILSTLENEARQLRPRVDAMMAKGLNRQEKVELIELTDRMHSISEKRQEIEADINTREKKILEDRKKIEELQRKSFVKRLLRR